MNPAYRVSSQPGRLLYSKFSLKTVNTINFAPEDIEEERSRYEGLIRLNSPDIACLGIGKSGHIAFNEPGQSSFHDLQDVRIIEVNQESKEQLMQDPNFKSLGVIPGKAITITIPVFIRCPNVFVIVPYKIKAPVVQRFMKSNVDESFPASILQTKQGAKLYLDKESYSMVEDSDRFH